RAEVPGRIRQGDPSGRDDDPRDIVDGGARVRGGVDSLARGAVWRGSRYGSPGRPRARIPRHEVRSTRVWTHPARGGEQLGSGARWRWWREWWERAGWWWRRRCA